MQLWKYEPTYTNVYDKIQKFISRLISDITFMQAYMVSRHLL